MHSMQKLQAAIGENEEGHWGIIDILTLILVFFIILYVSETKESPVDSATTQAEQPRQQSFAGQPIDINAYFAGHARDGFYLSASDKEITLVLEEKLSFAPARAELGGDSFAALDTIVFLLSREQGYDVVISGHTDDIPISNGEFSSNWHLATARAVAVAEYLLARGVEPRRLTAQGFAEYRPLTANDSVAGRQKNRRVEITLRNKGRV